jgi:glycosyltransferase involved in cell wall biosynthesis
VSTTVGAIPELLGGGEAGLVVAPHDLVGLRGFLDRLLDDARARRELGERGRARCEERHDARRQAAALAELVHDAAEESRG